ncbi:MFS transporter [Kitasatospora purpeofusca]|uniref:MFS transporter n=1 Tax=Kitasatospora purpeofusca TaxID=67352 RepID=UPI00224CE040|nr:MFS transporter [Kitasatospora purpeofusca]MCX4758007.1 MFS transporter [Kitasatospora purpeofusca]WSR31512.1 MFS transporter [Kitasatospora purpeofusca]
MPRAVYVLALGVFAMVTSEFAVAGLMPQLAEGLDATVPQIGYLITAFSVAMSFGGPLLAVALLRTRQKAALMLLFAIFLVGNVLAATASGYPVMLAARVVSGVAAQAFFGISISLCAQLTRPEVRGRAIAVLMNGLMLGTLLGLPLATVIGEHLGWRAAFWAVAVLTAAVALCTLAGVPDADHAEGTGSLRDELGALRDRRLWLAFVTSTLIIGATFTLFSYVNPILTELTGFPVGSVPLLLVAYGAATVVGNTVVGRLADRYALPVLATGLALNAVFLAGLALLAQFRVPAVGLLLGVGLVGVTMNPAMVSRVQRIGGSRPLVNTVHNSFITLGVILGSLLGGLAIDAWGLRAVLWLGVAMAVAGLLSLLPDVPRGRRALPGRASGARGNNPEGVDAKVVETLTIGS